jgi:hypothetical protein
MGGLNDIELREALYRQLARQPGLPAGLRPELIKRAERCVVRVSYATPPFMVARGNEQGCKGAIGR